MLVFLSVAAVVASLAAAQDAAAAGTQPVCSANQLFNGQICTCAPGYFSSASDESKTRCEDECEEVYFSFFTYGKCVDDIFGKVPREQQPACNMRCGMRLRLWASIGVFCIMAASLATLVFTIPMCIATCCSCLQAKKANKNAKRVYVESQQANGMNGKDSTAVATMGYNPYAYWPYYGRA
ncbi:hypothetical protein PRIPAC_85839 [Pristionchus pacificus]|uniref:Uncharacterized protein n=1 Tax=Pristionchus pacificus TaxID=54126 RepID=A0A2A6BUR3_PRIPA|nr:hypothetical protein PRIPAC_85839 [Pristionchus pacificus]|eukprot:PDM69556.1 hypothetical protein PRIPAC_44652 [Pristionchus pacificus]